MPTGVYTRSRVPCSEQPCPRTVVAHSRSGVCKYHATVAWKKAHRERVNVHNRRYEGQNPERARAWRRAWQGTHREAVADTRAVRRARKQGRFVEKVYRAKVLREHGGLCGICGARVDPKAFHVDHIVPLSRGGEHSYANTQPAHPACNLRKATRC